MNPSAELEEQARLQRFAYRVAAPRDFAINLVINGITAWWIYGHRDLIPLTGAASMFTLVLPMAFILCTLTTLFGILNGLRMRQKWGHRVSADHSQWWLLWAVGYSLIHGLIGLVIALAAQYGLSQMAAIPNLTPLQIIIGVGGLSAALAYVLHARAVVSSVKF